MIFYLKIKYIFLFRLILNTCWIVIHLMRKSIGVMSFLQVSNKDQVWQGSFITNQSLQYLMNVPVLSQRIWRNVSVPRFVLWEHHASQYHTALHWLHSTTQFYLWMEREGGLFKTICEYYDGFVVSSFKFWIDDQYVLLKVIVRMQVLKLAA